MCPSCEAAKAAMKTTGGASPEVLAKTFATGLGLKKYRTKCTEFNFLQGQKISIKARGYGLVIVGLNNSGDVLSVRPSQQSEVIISEGIVFFIEGKETRRVGSKRMRLLKPGMNDFRKTQIVRKSKIIRERHLLTSLKIIGEVKNKVASFVIIEILRLSKK